MRKYNLSFISDINLFNHVKETIEKYRFKINLKEFNKNLIDPIKLTLEEIEQSGIENSVFNELKNIDENILKSLYLLSFKRYEGFENLDI